mmetsp:Transcript_66276/g.138418  ORF Transcript_66276/g.138418 Transcript_66276/m.138418 type:complete len:278 (-) Transcript_66276:756-1589(-)
MAVRLAQELRRLFVHARAVHGMLLGSNVALQRIDDVPDGVSRDHRLKHLGPGPKVHHLSGVEEVHEDARFECPLLTISPDAASSQVDQERQRSEDLWGRFAFSVLLGVNCKGGTMRLGGIVKVGVRRPAEHLGILVGREGIEEAVSLMLAAGWKSKRLDSSNIFDVLLDATLAAGLPADRAALVAARAADVAVHLAASDAGDAPAVAGDALAVLVAAPLAGATLAAGATKSTAKRHAHWAAARLAALEARARAGAASVLRAGALRVVDFVHVEELGA